MSLVLHSEKSMSTVTSFLKYIFFTLTGFLKELDTVMVDVTYVTGTTQTKLESLLREIKNWNFTNFYTNR